MDFKAGQHYIYSNPGSQANHSHEGATTHMPHLQMRCGQPMQVPLVCASSVQAKHTSMHAGYAASCQSHATAHTCIHMYPSFYMHTACATVNMSSCEGVQSFMHITGLTYCTVQLRRPNQLCVYTGEMIVFSPARPLSLMENTQARHKTSVMNGGEGRASRHKNYPIRAQYTSQSVQAFL